MTSTTDIADPAPTGEQPPSRQPAADTRRAPSQESIDQFKERLAATKNEASARRALAIAQLITDEFVICPECGKPAPRGKFKIHPDGGWKHFSAEGCHGDAVSILQGIGIRPGDAVRVLLGLPTRTEIEIPENLAELPTAFVGVKSRIALDVFNGVLVYGRKTGGVEAAQEFYATWHIAPEVVEQWGAVYIKDPKHFAEAILAKFGAEKLISCGLFVDTDRGPFSLISAAFPVIEPHRHPATGDVLYMQLRGSHEQHARYLEHKRDPRKYSYRGREKFISLKGAPRAAQIGCGLHLLEQLPPGSDVYIVEGFKDGMAGQTLGLHTYAIPGVDFRPPEKICQLLARHNVFVALDGDEAGTVGRDGRVITDKDGNVTGQSEGLLGYLQRQGVRAQPKDIGGPGLGLDVTDFLVAGYASGKLNGGTRCACPQCEQMRNDHPDWFTAQ